MKQLILGGVRSGKSKLAEQVAMDSDLKVTYIATALSGDDEMQKRILQHQQRRPENWRIAEAPYELAACLLQHAKEDGCLLVDCLTLWLTNRLCADDEALFIKELNAFLVSIDELPGDIIFVSNETSMGIIPLGELARRFCDEAGVLHQQVAQRCDRVVLTVAGLAHVLKDEA